jgi:hypothetical protein
MALTTTAHAQNSFTSQTFAVLPPLGYDHPYQGELTLVRGDTNDMAFFAAESALLVLVV